MYAILRKKPRLPAKGHWHLDLRQIRQEIS
eukprot:SAG22_NODE_14800_length_364_cov_1.490566_1_plen_29_part_10